MALDLSALGVATKKVKTTALRQAPRTTPFATTKLGIALNTLLGIPEVARDILFPTRGFEEKELREARPSVGQKALGLPKVAAEFTADIGELIGGTKIAQRFIETRVGRDLSALAPAGRLIEEFGEPKNIEEAQAMRFADVFLSVPIASVKIGATGARTIARTRSLKTISGVLRKEAPRLTDEQITTLSKMLQNVDNTDDVERVINRTSLAVQEVRKAGETAVRKTDGTSAKPLSLDTTTKKQIDTFLAERFGKTLEKATASETRTALSETNVFVPHTDTFLKKIAKVPDTLKKPTLRPELFFGGVSKDRFTDTFLAIVDPVAANKINQEILKRELDKEVRVLQKTTNESHVDIVKTLTKNQEKQIKESADQFPKLDELVAQQKEGTKATIQGYFDNKIHTLAVLSDGKQQVQVNAGYLKEMRARLPDSEIRIVDDRSAVQFVKDGKITGLIMPIVKDSKLPKGFPTPNQIITAPAPPISPAPTSSVKTTPPAQPLKEVLPVSKVPPSKPSKIEAEAPKTLQKARSDATDKIEQEVSSLPEATITKEISQGEKNTPPPTAENTKTIQNDWRGAIELPPETLGQAFRRSIEDFNIRLKILNDKIEEVAGAKIDENFNLYAQKDMLPRKQSDLLRRVRDERTDFVKRLVVANIKVDDLDEYLHAKHAIERNAKMNELRIEKKQPTEDGLSGMTDVEAKKILAKDNKKFEAFEDEIRKINEETLQFMVDNDLLRVSEAENIRGLYKYYVPLFRDIGEDFTGIGKGVSVQLKEIKRAKGSLKRVTSPLGNVFHRKERAQISALKNSVGKTIIEMTEEMPFLKDVFRVEKEPMGIVARVERKAEIDTQFFNNLISFAKELGLRDFTTNARMRQLGVFRPGFNTIERVFASSRETTAHEVGHFLDHKYKLKQRFFKNRKETRDVGREIFEHSEKQVGENRNRLAKVEERFANAFSWWLVNRNLARKSMPLFNKEMADIIATHPELRPLRNIVPTAQPQLEHITEDIWGKVFRPGDNVIIAKIKGVEHFITINDQKTARALKNLNIARVPQAMQHFRAALGIWSSMKTRWRPEFLITNFERDLGEAMINLGVEKTLLKEQGKGLRKAIVKDLFPSQRQVWKYLRGGQNPQADEFFRLGGDAGHFWLDSVTDAEKSLAQLEKEIANVGIEKIKNPIRAAGQVVDDLNSMIELGIRYSTYKQLVKRGMSKEASIQATADLTLNFSRQGELSPVMKSAYGFINPAIQGTSKVVRTIGTKEGQKRIIAAVTALTMLGFITRTVSMMIDNEGDEQINDWAKNHKLAFANGRGGQITLWSMPYGYTSFYSLGSNISEALFGKKTIREATTNVLETTVDSFSPFGTKLSDFIPTLAKPIFDINNNDAWYDGKIHPDQVFTRTPKPDAETYFSSASQTSIFIAEFLQKISGGGDGKAGIIDVSPNDLEYAYDQFVGGPFEFVSSSIEATARGIDGEFDPNKTPFVRQVYRENKAQQWSYGTIYDTLERAYKKDVSDMEKERFYRAVDTGLEEQIFDQDRANGFIRDFVKAQYRIVGSITSDEAIAQIKLVPEEDQERLINSYAEGTQKTIRRKLGEEVGTSEKKLEDIFRGGEKKKTLEDIFR